MLVVQAMKCITQKMTCSLSEREIEMILSSLKSNYSSIKEEANSWMLKYCFEHLSIIKVVYTCLHIAYHMSWTLKQLDAQSSNDNGEDSRTCWIISNKYLLLRH